MAGASVNRLKAEGSTRLLTVKRATAQQLLLRTGRKPFDDPRLVRAVQLGLDRQALVRVALAGHGEPGNDLFGLGLRGYPDGLKPRERGHRLPPAGPRRAAPPSRPGPFRPALHQPRPARSPCADPGGRAVRGWPLCAPRARRRGPARRVVRHAQLRRRRSVTAQSGTRSAALISTGADERGCRPGVITHRRGARRRRWPRHGHRRGERRLSHRPRLPRSEEQGGDRLPRDARDGRDAPGYCRSLAHYSSSMRVQDPAPLHDLHHGQHLRPPHRPAHRTSPRRPRPWRRRSPRSQRTQVTMRTTAPPGAWEPITWGRGVPAGAGRGARR
ncbi:ABC transporter substrate-binding protein [Streptomyces violaceusniger]|uniref:ABC transporter substrate-binding protein n=1 Tax=Streptomyces violaceusniger TaxID=68280 RepID=UPI0036765750